MRFAARSHAICKSRIVIVVQLVSPIWEQAPSISHMTVVADHEDESFDSWALW
jgi:hypothetical protein